MGTLGVMPMLAVPQRVFKQLVMRSASKPRNTRPAASAESVLDPDERGDATSAAWRGRRSGGDSSIALEAAHVGAGESGSRPTGDRVYTTMRLSQNLKFPGDGGADRAK